jgi:uncharacterized protein YndB with AHSA1/START domain
MSADDLDLRFARRTHPPHDHARERSAGVSKVDTTGLRSSLENLMSAARSSFVYVMVVRTTPEKLWEALTDAKLIRRYWFNAIVECGWKKGSPWRKFRGDGSLTDSGEILEIDPPRRMVIRWQGEWKPEFKAEGPSRCTLALEPMDGAVKLTSTHEIERPESKFITALSEGWPLVLSNLKSLLETGEVAMTNY